MQRKWGMGQIISRVLAIWKFPPGAKNRQDTLGREREGGKDIMYKNRRLGGKDGHRLGTQSEEQRNAQEDVCYTSETCRVLALHAFFLFVA